MKNFDDLKYSRYYNGLPESIIKMAFEGNEQAISQLMIQYSGIISFVIDKYAYLIQSDEHMEDIRNDAFHSMRNAIQYAFENHNIQDYIHSYLLSSVMWHIYFGTIVKRAKPNTSQDVPDSVKQLNIDDIYLIILEDQHERNCQRNLGNPTNPTLECVTSIFDTLDKKFDIKREFRIR